MSNLDPVLAGLAERINLAHEGAMRSARTAIEHAIECGELLTEAKALVGHGNWLPWLQANTIVSERTAQRWMRFAENAETLLAKSDTDGGFTFADADRLLAAPKAKPAAPDAAATSTDNSWLTRLWAEHEATIAAAGKRLPELQAEFDAATKIEDWMTSSKAVLAARNELQDWYNRLTEARMRLDREIGATAADEVIEQIAAVFGKRASAFMRLWALIDDETFDDAIETVKRRDEELTDKRLRREIEWRLKQRSSQPAAAPPDRPGPVKS